ncbi:uridine kinase [Nocardiopsis sp. Huas11]|uniref:uridine kinase family protein n=1 Tax=Nocardiopsis sp. Huas11 TaxID=2183912 RepID=UPI000EB5176C|nr:phosphoribulokinase [Nocardiopsis sp. Huas11]RKS07899.1 uridine kinase [Nocardiopsis sp. Huas11]
MISTAERGWQSRAVSLLPDRGAGVRVVAVEGRSGSGKSTVADHLRADLAARGEPVHVLTMEDLYPGWDGLARAPHLLRDWVLAPLRRGEPAAWHRYDWERGGFAPEWTRLPEDVAAGGTLVVEGCGAGARQARALTDALVWVAVPGAERSRRLDARGDAAVYGPHRDRWARQEEDFYAGHRPREHAGMVIDNPRAADPR